MPNIVDRSVNLGNIYVFSAVLSAKLTYQPRLTVVFPGCSSGLLTGTLTVYEKKDLGDKFMFFARHSILCPACCRVPLYIFLSGNYGQSYRFPKTYYPLLIHLRTH